MFGFWDGEGEPAYLPVDDSHPRLAGRPYGRSKRVGEDLCEVWSTRTGIPSIALQPVLVVDDADVAVVRRDHLAMDAFVHVEDVVTAVLAALNVELPAHTRALLSSSGPFDVGVAQQLLGWAPLRPWPRRSMAHRAARVRAGLARRLRRG